MRSRSSDALVWFVCGILMFDVAADAGREPARASSPSRIGVLAEPGEAGGRADPDSLSARALRALPGIGPARALAIARARWTGLRGGPTAWTSLPGIGDATAAAAATALSGAAMEPPSERAYTRREYP